MGVHIEVQDTDIIKQVRARETQLDNIERLNTISEAVDNINTESIEITTNEIKNIVQDNLQEQPNLDEILESMQKVAQGISDIKRSQTNLNKKIKDLQTTVDELHGDNND